MCVWTCALCVCPNVCSLRIKAPGIILCQPFNDEPSTWQFYFPEKNLNSSCLVSFILIFQSLKLFWKCIWQLHSLVLETCPGCQLDCCGESCKCSCSCPKCKKWILYQTALHHEYFSSFDVFFKVQINLC